MTEGGGDRWEPVIPPPTNSAGRPPNARTSTTDDVAHGPLDGVAVGSAAGRLAVGAGLLLLAFAAYQLWGTGHHEAQAQEALRTELAARQTQRALGPALDEPQAPTPQTPEHQVPVPQVPEPLASTRSAPMEPADAALIGRAPDRQPSRPAAVPVSAPIAEPIAVGDPLATLRIPAIGVDKTVVEGTTREALRSGPGHYLGTARPGQAGNVAIAGHRTTYGAPFRHIDDLVPGDEIVLETADGTFTYRVESPDGSERGHRIVSPDEVGVIADRGDHRLTLTACHPLYSARQRIVVTAVLDDPPAAAPTPPSTTAEVARVALPAPSQAWGGRPPTEGAAAPTTLPAAGSSSPGPGPVTGSAVGPELGDDGLGWQWDHLGITATWAGLTALAAGVAWILARRWRPWPAYLMAAPSFSLALVTFFGHLDRLIPAA